MIPYNIYLLAMTGDGVSISPNYEVNSGHVIVADSPRHARVLASKVVIDEPPCVWLDERYSSCVMIGQATLDPQEQRVVLSEENAS